MEAHRVIGSSGNSVTMKANIDIPPCSDSAGKDPLADCAGIYYDNPSATYGPLHDLLDSPHGNVTHMPNGILGYHSGMIVSNRKHNGPHFSTHCFSFGIVFNKAESACREFARLRLSPIFCCKKRNSCGRN